MRKTLTVLMIALVATSLAACKMFWEKDQPPAPVASAAADPASTAPTAQAAPEPAATAPAATAAPAPAPAAK